jgi:hypothetical protein
MFITDSEFPFNIARSRVRELRGEYIRRVRFFLEIQKCRRRELTLQILKVVCLDAANGREIFSAMEGGEVKEGKEARSWRVVPSLIFP